MKLYLTYSPIILLFIWIWIVVKSLTSVRRLKILTGIPYFSLLKVCFSMDYSNESNKVKHAVEEHKNMSRKLVRIWAITVLVYITLTIIVAILTEAVFD